MPLNINPIMIYYYSSAINHKIAKSTIRFNLIQDQEIKKKKKTIEIVTSERN